MARNISGVAKVNVRDEVDACVLGLRSQSVLEVESSALQLQHSLAEVVGANLHPFLNRLGGELVAVCKRVHVPAVWESAASLVLATGGAASKSVCEPLIDLLVHNPAVRDDTSLTAAAAFVAVAGRFIPSPLRCSLDYAVVKHLYDALVFETVPTTLVHEYLQILSASLASPTLRAASPVHPHAVAVAQRAAHHPRLPIDTRTSALTLLHFLDTQMHAQAAPIAVPTLAEVTTHLKRLEGTEDDMGLFDAQPTRGTFDAPHAGQSESATPAQSQPIFEKPPQFGAPRQAEEIEPRPAQGAAVSLLGPSSDSDASQQPLPTLTPQAARGAAAGPDTSSPRKRARLEAPSGSLASLVPQVQAMPSLLPSAVQPLSATPASLLEPVEVSPALLTMASVPLATTTAPAAAAAAASAAAAPAPAQGAPQQGDDAADEEDVEETSSISASLDLDLPDVEVE